LRRQLRRVERRLQPPGPSVLDLISTAWFAQGVYTATKLGIIEALRDGPQSADVVAAAVDANPDAVFQLMRLLTSRGIFTQQRDRRFALAPMGEALRADASDSMRGYVLFAGNSLHWEHWGQLSHSVRTGRCAVEELRGKPTFEWFEDVPELAAVFNDGMTSISKMETPALGDPAWITEYSRNPVRCRIGRGGRAHSFRGRRCIGSMHHCRRILFRIRALRRRRLCAQAHHS